MLHPRTVERGVAAAWRVLPWVLQFLPDSHSPGQKSPPVGFPRGLSRAAAPSVSLFYRLLLWSSDFPLPGIPGLFKVCLPHRVQAWSQGERVNGQGEPRNECQTPGLGVGGLIATCTAMP